MIMLKYAICLELCLLVLNFFDDFVVFIVFFYLKFPFILALVLKQYILGF